jgi:hypothetical protein
MTLWPLENLLLYTPLPPPPPPQHLSSLPLHLKGPKHEIFVAELFMQFKPVWVDDLKVHKIENFFDSDFGICVISLLVMSKY